MHCPLPCPLPCWVTPPDACLPLGPFSLLGLLDTRQSCVVATHSFLSCSLWRVRHQGGHSLIRHYDPYCTTDSGTRRRPAVGCWMYLTARVLQAAPFQVDALRRRESGRPAQAHTAASLGGRTRAQAPASLAAQMVKNLPATRETQVRSLDQEDSPGQRSLGLQSKHFAVHFRGGA